MPLQSDLLTLERLWLYNISGILPEHTKHIYYYTITEVENERNVYYLL